MFSLAMIQLIRRFRRGISKEFRLAGKQQYVMPWLPENFSLFESSTFICQKLFGKGSQTGFLNERSELKTERLAEFIVSCFGVS